MMDEFAMDASVTYRDLEPLIEAEVNDTLPDGLIQPEWLDLTDLDPQWLEEPAIEPGWLDLPEIEPDWLLAIDQGELEMEHDMPAFEQDFDLEH